MANYAEEIKKAINSGASVDTVKSLNDQRNAKISANSDYYGSKGISSQDNIATMAEDYINAGSGSKSIDAYTAPSYRNVSGSYSGGTASDYSNYLRELYAQKEASDLAALKSAYDKNISSLQAAREQITPAYQAARNETAAQNEIARQGFNEYAAARGLNTGTSGQAELTRSAALQSNLANLLAEEKNALTENQRQQDDLLSQYNSAVAQAKAGYGTELAQALYNELVRQDQANQSLLQYSESAQQAKADAARQTAMTAINLGVVPSEDLLNSAGMSLADAQAMADAVKAANAAAAAKKVTSGSSGSGGSDYMSLLEKMRGYGNDEQAMLYLLSQGLSNDRYTDVWNLYLSGRGNENDNVYESLYNQISHINPGTTASVGATYADKISSALQAGRLTEKQADNLLKMLGV